METVEERNRCGLPDYPRPPVGAEPEIGTTLADARRLAKRAKWVFVHYLLTDEPLRTECIMLSPTTFLRATSHQGADMAMPCRLAPALLAAEVAGELWLRIGA